MAKKSQSKTQLSILLLALILSISLAYLASAAPTQDNTARYWMDNFTDQTGIAALSHLNFSAGNFSLSNTISL